MLKNYVKIAYRNLLRHKGYAVINVCGLALGIACCLLIGLYVQDELSFDRFHERGERIYRVNQHVTRADVGDETWAWTGGGLGEDLEADFAHVEAVVRFTQRAGIVRYEREGAGDVRSFREEDVLFTDPEVFDVFTFPLVRGNPETALQDPGSIVVTRSMAAKYFGEEDPIGETLEYDGRPYTVTAIAADVPPNSHLRFDFLLPTSAFKVINSFPVEAGFGSYWWPYMWTYVLLPNEETAKALQAQMPAFSERHRTDGDAFVPTLEPLHAIHLQSAAEPGTEPDVPGAGGDLATVRTFALIALAVLLLACINFMNLSTARSAKRAKEVGVRKTVGAGRPQLVGQFLGESVLLSLLALVLAVGLVELLLPLFNLLAGREISVGYAENGAYWLGLLGLVGVTGLAAGAYPALYLSGFRPARVLKGARQHLARRRRPLPEGARRVPVRRLHRPHRRDGRRLPPAPLHAERPARLRRGGRHHRPLAGRRRVGDAGARVGGADVRAGGRERLAAAGHRGEGPCSRTRSARSRPKTPTRPPSATSPSTTATSR